MLNKYNNSYDLDNFEPTDEELENIEKELQIDD